MTSLTRDIGTFVSELTYERIPTNVLPSVRAAFADFTACVLLGRDDDVTRIVRDTLTRAGQSGEARVLFGVARASASEAALINGTASHARDYDDVGLVGIQPTHPSASIAPAIFAEAEALRRDGRAMLTAYVVAYEVWGELASRDRDPIHLKGWHPTGTFGAIAAAAAAASLHGLDAHRASTAVAIAASLSSGVIANFGSMTKPFHAGRAAQSGVIAARLAAAGMTAASDALECDLGFLRAISPRGAIDTETSVGFGDRWFLESHGLGFKLFPMCYGAHRALDGMSTLMAKHPFSPEDVELIEIEAPRSQFSNLVHTNPTNPLDAKFSMEFAMAAMIIARRCTGAEFDEAFINHPDTRSLMGRVRRVFIEGQDREGDGAIVMLRDGRRLDQRFTHPLGDARRPPSREALWTKFADCVSESLAPSEAGHMFDILSAIDELKSMAGLPLAH